MALDLQDKPDPPIAARRLTRSGAPRRTTLRLPAAVIVGLLAIAVVATPATTRPSAPAALTGPVGHQGRWLTDAQGRVLLPQGVNLVAKGVSETPADMGFGADDAAFLADNGFDVVRLGTTAASLMPEPGMIDEAYVESFVGTVEQLTDAGLLVLVDLHQDGWGPSLGSDGFPEWMTLTHGAENTNTEFPLYYVTNPAIQAAFDSFWANEDGPGGVPLQDRVATMFTELAGRLSDDPGVLGYDLLNEPWPGTTWQPCVNDPAGCPAQDQALDDYHQAMTTAIRSEDSDSLVFGEPYVLFNFGTAPTTVGLPGGDANSGLSYHVYPTDPANEDDVVAFADQWSQRTGGALLNTEFGATDDTAAIDRQVDLFEASLNPWMWWAYNENFIEDLSQAPTEDNLVSPVVDTLVRPHPQAVAGTPVAHDYDVASRVLAFRYSTDPVGELAAGAETVFQLAPRTYPEGYQSEVTGGTVTSEPGASRLTVAADPGASEVAVEIRPVGTEEPDEGDQPGGPGGPDGTTPAPGAPPAQPVPASPDFTG